MSVWVSEESYWILFLALLVGGETVLMPALYLAMTNRIELVPLFVLSLVATALADTTLYVVGRFLPWGRVESSRLVRRRFAVFKVALDSFIRNRLRYLFLSRFVYGTRSVVQVLCGATRLPVVRYAAVNLAGAAVWLSLLTGLVVAMDMSLAWFQVEWFRVQLSFGVLLVLLLLFQKWIRTQIKPLASPRSSPPSTKEPPSARSYEQSKTIL